MPATSKLKKPASLPKSRPAKKKRQEVLRFSIREARSATDISVVRRLFREYANSLSISLCFQNFEEELATLPGFYGRPSGRLYLVKHDGKAIACIGFRPVEPHVCELKRLYVKPPFRQFGLGRQLSQLCLREAAHLGYKKMVLDTLKSMLPARRLYRELGFKPVKAYYHNPFPDVVYLEKNLSAND